MNARGRFAVLESIAAHVAFAYDAPGLVVLGRVVRAHQGAVLAAEALIIQMLHDARDGIFLVGLRRTAVHARWVDAVVTRGSHRLQRGGRRRSAVEQPDRAPDLIFIEPIEAVAGGNASLAPGAGIEVDLKRILLAWLWALERNPFANRSTAVSECCA